MAHSRNSASRTTPKKIPQPFCCTGPLLYSKRLSPKASRRVYPGGGKPRRSPSVRALNRSPRGVRRRLFLIVTRINPIANVFGQHLRIRQRPHEVDHVPVFVDLLVLVDLELS